MKYKIQTNALTVFITLFITLSAAQEESYSEFLSTKK